MNYSDNCFVFQQSSAESIIIKFKISRKYNVRIWALNQNNQLVSIFRSCNSN